MNLTNVMVLAFFCGVVHFTDVCSAKKDYYKTLGLEKGASDKQIKKAFRKLALKYHPDKNPDKDTSKKFREIAEAYDVLRDADKRREYDQMGHSGGFKPGHFNFDDILKDFDDDFFGDLRGHFSNHFGSHKMHHDSAGGHFDFGDMKFQEFFNSPFGGDDSDLFGRDMDMFGSSNKVRTESRNGQRCKTVTQKVGNMVTTYTQCS